MPQAEVLLVAHSPLVREGLGHLLAGDGLSVVGEELTLPRALSFLRMLDRKVDFLIYDDENHGSNIADLGMIRDEFPQTGLVILTAGGNAGDLDEAIRAGVRAVLPKSVSGKALCLTLQLLLLQPDLTAWPQPASGQGGLTVPSAAKNGSHSWARLSPRESDILKLITDGASNKQIARRLNLAEATVKVHVKSLMRKIEVDNRTQAAIWGLDPTRCDASDG